MVNRVDDKKPHFILSNTSETELYEKPSTSFEKHPIPDRDRNTHGTSLLGQIQDIKPTMEAAKAIQQAAGLEGGFGLQVEFESFPGIELAFESLERNRDGIELLNVRRAVDRIYATILVPYGKLNIFEHLILDYMAERKTNAGRSKDNKALINTIQSIRSASLNALWTDDEAVFPQSDDEAFWWEVWLPVREDRKAMVATFRQLAGALGFRLAPGDLKFPERTIVLIYGSAGQMKRSMMTLNSIAELRRAKETADFFDSLHPREQPAWLEELLERTTFREPDDSVPHVCILDTGINRAHPLLSHSIKIGRAHV